MCPPFFVTELHDYGTGCADITSLNEMRLFLPGTNIHSCFHPSLLLAFGFIFYIKPGTWSHLWFAGVRESPPWCSIVGA